MHTPRAVARRSERTAATRTEFVELGGRFDGQGTYLSSSNERLACPSQNPISSTIVARPSGVLSEYLYLCCVGNTIQTQGLRDKRQVSSHSLIWPEILQVLRRAYTSTGENYNYNEIEIII